MTMPIPIVSSALVFMLAVEPGEPRYLPTSIEVDVEKLVEQAPDKDEEFQRLERITSDRTGQQVRESVRETLVQHGVPLESGAPSVAVVVRLEWKVYLDSHYVAHIIARGRDGTEQVVDVECKLCSEPKLAATVAEHVSEILPALEAAEAAPQDEPTPGSTEPRVAEPQPQPVGPGDEVDTDHARKVGPVGWAGVASLALGVGVTVGGIIVLSEDPTVQLQPLDRHVEETISRRPLGIGLTATGASLLGAGIVMLVLDQTILRRRRARGRASAEVVPSISPTRAGLALTGRF